MDAENGSSNPRSNDPYDSCQCSLYDTRVRVMAMIAWDANGLPACVALLFCYLNHEFTCRHSAALPPLGTIGICSEGLAVLTSLPTLFIPLLLA